MRSRCPTALTPTAADAASTPRMSASGASSQPDAVAVVEPGDEAAGKGEHGEREDEVDREDAAQQGVMGRLATPPLRHARAVPGIQR